MDDLRNKNFKEQGNTNIENLILVELSILCNLLTSEFLVPQLIPNLEKEGIDEVIQQYIKNKYANRCF